MFIHLYTHSQGRCPEQYSKMIQQVVAYNEGKAEASEEGGGGRTPLRVSVELEKPYRPELAQLAPLADVVSHSSSSSFSSSSFSPPPSPPPPPPTPPLPPPPPPLQLLLSKEYAQYRGYRTMEETVVRFRDSAKRK